MNSMAQEWLGLVYGDLGTGTAERARTMLREHPELRDSAPLAVGDAAAVRNRIAAGGLEQGTEPFGMPPLVAVTFSRLGRIAEFGGPLRECARLLLEAGADPNGKWTNPEWPDLPLSALYGAAGRTHDPEMTQILLAAGADPNDGESLYHSLESRDPSCTKLLIAAGVRVAGNNAVYHALDYDDVERLKLLLANGGDANEESKHLGRPLYHAIRRGRSVEHIRALLAAGADPGPAYRPAMLFGRTDIAEVLGVTEELSEEDRFVAACARADAGAAKAMMAKSPDLMRRLTEEQLRQLPNLVEAGREDAARVMVELGWPVGARGGDWNASALNLAVFRGDAGLTRFLLEHGASWEERHGFNDNVMGTLSWASLNRPRPDGDWVACARELIAGGMPVPPESYRYSPDVARYFAGLA